jgi:drug/metabolite transporter (DMT)-like permease
MHVRIMHRKVARDLARKPIRPMAQALLAALLFGASTPLAKVLLGEIEPVPLSALLYLGSGLGLLAVQLARRIGGEHAGEAPLSGRDLPWLAGAVLAGGVAAPIVLLFSLRVTPAATASLLLNIEGVATTLLAAVVFREAIGRRVWVAMAVISLAGALLSLGDGGEWGLSAGALGVLAACVLWGLDNNLTRQIADRDPIVIVTIKGLAAGAISLILAVALGMPWPAPRALLAGLALGSVSYGASVVLFVLAMRSLGATRTSALYGTAPFAGAILSFVLLPESPDPLLALAFGLMIAGAALLVSEEHAHHHVHSMVEHDHRHHHGEHHAHTHAEQDGAAAHAHRHRHDPRTHEHPHTPDTHHRHDHS